ncbi:MAG: hypothetical protein ACPGVV_09290, partial [Croceimicrobium sp.]
MISTKTPKLLKFAFAAALALTITSCSDDDDDNMDTPMEPSKATLDISTQVISQNMVEVSMVDLPSDGWIVIHADNG